MKRSILCMLVSAFVALSACQDDDVPPAESPEEQIDEVQLLFAPTAGAPVVVKATDPDQEGPESIVPDGPIVLKANTSYELFISFSNVVSGDITPEIEEEGEEHMLFFGFTPEIFSSPQGNGNLDSRMDPLNYVDQDSTGLPLGLITGWVTGEAATGTFQIVLKHQPDIKSESSNSSDGATDVSLQWNLTIE